MFIKLLFILIECFITSVIKCGYCIISLVNVIKLLYCCIVFINYDYGYFVSIILLLIEPVKSCMLLRLLNVRTLINLKIRYRMSRSMTLAWNNHCF